MTQRARDPTEREMDDTAKGRGQEQRGRRERHVAVGRGPSRGAGGTGEDEGGLGEADKDEDEHDDPLRHIPDEHAPNLHAPRTSSGASSSVRTASNEHVGALSIENVSRPTIDHTSDLQGRVGRGGALTVMRRGPMNSNGSKEWSRLHLYAHLVNQCDVS
eukprot:3216799-Rhodomonas_salina.2